jgi:hypothetical protein
MTSNPQPEDFYIGYSNCIPGRILKFLAIVVPVIIAIGFVLALILPGFHHQSDPGAYAGAPAFEGILLDKPIPHLMVPRKGNTQASEAYSRYVLAAPNKAAFSPKLLETLSGQWVTLNGLPVYRDQLTLLASASAQAKEPPPGQALEVPPGQPLGDFTLTGEIIDSKCYLGVMKPGQTKTHRECAIRCISGGVPPSLLVHNGAGDAMYFLLVDREGKAINNRILDVVADPVQVTGEVVQYGDLFVLQANPEDYELVS